MAVLTALLIISMVVFRSEPEGRRERVFYGCFDTVSHIYSYADESFEEFTENATLAEETLEAYHKLFDIYNEYDGITGGLYQVNQNAGVAPVKVPRELIDFLDYCLEAYELTGGEVNIAMGAVLRLWHECRLSAEYNPQEAKIPDREALLSAAEHCDINNIIIDRENSTVYLSDPLMSLDVGAVGKGYAVEKAAQILKNKGVSGYALDIGGNIRIIGEKPSKEPFKTGIKDPTGKSENGYADILELNNTSAVTSGGYERCYYVGGKRYHHIIDKDTLTSPDYFASVTVVSEDSALADVLSTALFCMELEDGRALVQPLDGVLAIWVLDDGTVIRSK